MNEYDAGGEILGNDSELGWYILDCSVIGVGAANQCFTGAADQFDAGREGFPRLGFGSIAFEQISSSPWGEQRSQIGKAHTDVVVFR